MLANCWRKRWSGGAPPIAIVCDRWPEAELREELAKSEYPRCPVVVRGTGFLDGGQDVREFRAACVREREARRRPFTYVVIPPQLMPTPSVPSRLGEFSCP